MDRIVLRYFKIKRARKIRVLSLGDAVLPGAPFSPAAITTTPLPLVSTEANDMIRHRRLAFEGP
jgi:hypothetical protein